MKKNGFTLIELIITIALLGLVGVVISVNTVNLINKQNIKKGEEFKELVEEAACTYVILSDASWNGTSVEGIKLVERGLIDEVVNGYQVSDYTVKVEMNNGERNCTLEGEI
ncbi:MAG: type II secretion system protein [Bacilli bacterium]|nr:type II secretion system protein [Bacilli bacterium]